MEIVMVIEIKQYQLKKYHDKIRQYLIDFINNLKKSDTWKIQLILAINYMSSKDADEEHVIHPKSDKIKIMTYDKAGEVIKERFEWILYRYQTDLEEWSCL